MDDYTKQRTVTSGLPQDILRELADTLQATDPLNSGHDIKLARHLAEVLDKPRRDYPLRIEVIDLAMSLIADMREATQPYKGSPK